MVAICKLIRDSLADGGNRPLDLAAIDKVLDQMPAKNRVNADFFVGRYLCQPAPARCRPQVPQALWRPGRVARLAPIARNRRAAIA